MKEEKEKKKRANLEGNYHDGGTLTHYLGNDDYKEGNRENEEDVQEKGKKVGYVANGNSEMSAPD